MSKTGPDASRRLPTLGLFGPFAALLLLGILIGSVLAGGGFSGELRWSDAAAALGLLSVTALIVRHSLTAQRLQHSAARSQRMAAVTERSQDAIVLYDANGRIHGWNRGAAALYGYSEEEARGMNLSALYPGGDGGAPRAMLMPRREGAVEVDRVHRDGNTLRVSATVTRIEEPGGQVLFSSTDRDITARTAVERQIHELAFYDPLTRLPNRRQFEGDLERTLDLAKRHQRLVGLLFLDLDRFKHINDTLGHKAGDELLCRIAERISESVRGTDFVARPASDDSASVVSRLGGDEFTVVLSEIEDTNDAAIVAQRIIGEISAPLDIDGQQIFPAASVGIAVCPYDGDTAAELLRKADLAMYGAKRKGPNHCCFYEASMEQRSNRYLAIESALRRALSEGSMHVEYQPIVDGWNRRIIGAEALLRWTDPELGSVAPDEFIPIAEDVGLSVPIGIWTLREACRQWREWQDAGLPAVQIAVNVSPHQLRHASFVPDVKAAIREFGIDASQLVVEMTESAFMEEDEATRETFQSLKHLGVGLALDDFGTGYSSLSYLRSFPLDRLKIDRSFVAEVCEAGHGAALTESIIGMAHSLDMQVIAEGVETAAQAGFLEAIGCDALQGFHFSKPISGEAFATLLARSTPDAEDGDLPRRKPGPGGVSYQTH